MPAMADFDDPEEAEAWAAMRAAFADDDAAAGISFSSVDPTNFADDAPAQDNDVKSGDASSDAKAGEKVASLPSKLSVAKKTSIGKLTTPAGKATSTVAKPEEKDAEPMPAMDQVWLQEQVDRLVGEVQRLGGGPFSARMLSQLWSIPLEEQHDVLLGTTGSKGDILETALERAGRIWKLVGEELSARCGTSRTPAGSKKTGARERSRSRSRSGSRSRSPSI
eukprot:TRINITY_DN74224_c0_g1_i1.p1 TRINITY_DN74224_c0_g1~~TRINITY_DN74224_c0_g1_i1.p1  ORF type:complete len:222 (-),score=46.81 TRINITY_DN74224_c0_g1_i1:209-874(-)